MVKKVPQPYSSFSYKSGNSLVHRMPSWAKMLLLPVLSIVFFRLPPVCSVAFIVFQCAVSFLLRFSLREQLADLKPVIFYAVALYLTSFIAYFCTELSSNEFRGVLHSASRATTLCFSNTDSAVLLVKIFCLMQSASIVFKTSTSLEIREGVGVIEHFVRTVLPCRKKNTFTNTISLFVCFIPLVFKIWGETKRSWKARCGKSGPRMYMTLFTVVFIVGMKKASNAARAVAARNA